MVGRPRWEIEGERLEMHRARLADGDSGAMPADEANVTQPDRETAREGR